MEQLIRVLLSNRRRMELRVQGDGLYMVSVFTENGRTPIVVRDGPTAEKALTDATEMLVTHGENHLANMPNRR